MTDNDLLRFGVIAVASRREILGILQQQLPSWSTNSWSSLHHVSVTSRRKILGILQQAWRWKQARRLDPSSSL